MSSLSARLLISVSILLLIFFGATGIVLDTAFQKAGEQAREDVLDGHLMAILAAAEASEAGDLVMPPDLQESRFSAIGSGLYAEIRDSEGTSIWRSRSALGLSIPFGLVSQDGSRLFREESLEDGTPMLTLSIAVQWEFPDGELKPYIFKVAESLDSYNAQVASFRQQLFGWFGAVTVIMLIAIAILLGSLLRPLRQIETQIGEIEAGSRKSLAGEFPTELQGVARNMNLLIDSERARSERYKQTLDNLAHSLKTPLAAMRALITQTRRMKQADRFNEQIDRMDEIVRYQLRKPAASGAAGSLMSVVPVEKEIERLVEGLRKVYHDKEPDIRSDIVEGAQFRGDKGDFLEVAGNLLDNACKWCKGRVRITVRPNDAGLILSVSDDGPGIPEEAADALLQRGTRLDESTPGHGIGLAVVKDIARSYGGDLTIRESQLGGAEIRVTLPAA